MQYLLLLGPPPGLCTAYPWCHLQTEKKFSLLVWLYLPTAPNTMTHWYLLAGTSTAPQGKGSQGKGSQGKGSQGKGSQGKGSQGKGSQGQGSQGKGSQGQGSQGQGSQGKGSQGQGSQGKGSQGKGSEGQGSQEWVDGECRSFEGSPGRALLWFLGNS